jgi:hypothetical protein
MPLRRALLCVCAAMFPVFASTYSASIFETPFPPGSGMPQSCSQSDLMPVSCNESLTVDQGSAFAEGEASSGITTSLFPGIPFIAATVNGDANTADYPQEFVNLVGNASFDVTITILGKPAGTPGYIGFQIDVAQPDFGHATLDLPTQLSNPAPACPFTQGPCASFLFGAPYQIQGNVNLGISQDLTSGVTAIGDFTIYDQNFRLLESAAMPDPNGVIDVVPEPSTILLLVPALAFLLWLGSGRICGAGRSPTNPTAPSSPRCCPPASEGARPAC